MIKPFSRLGYYLENKSVDEVIKLPGDVDYCETALKQMYTLARKPFDSVHIFLSPSYLPSILGYEVDGQCSTLHIDQKLEVGEWYASFYSIIDGNTRIVYSEGA